MTRRSSLVRNLAIVAATLPSLLTAGCLWQFAPQLEGPEPGFATLHKGTAGVPTESYVLQPGDAIGVRFYSNPELNEDVEVRPDGMISLPLVDDVRAAGLTPKALDDDLTSRFKSELANPQVTVILKRAAGHRVYVGGEVGTQGAIKLVGNMTLLAAIQKAGGFKVGAHRRQVILIRRNEEGVPIGRSIDVRDMQNGVHPEADVPLQPYDIVFVPRSKIADVGVFVQQYIRDVLPVQGIPIAF